MRRVEQRSGIPARSRPVPRRRRRRAATRRAARAISRIAATGSLDVVEVVPTVATTHIGRRPARDVGVERLSSASARIANAVVDRNLHDVLAPDAERDRALLDVRVGVFGDVDAQRRQIGAPRHPAFADLEAQRLARGGQRGEAADRRGVVDDAVNAAGSPSILAQPAAATTSSSSVAAGDVRHSIALTSSVAASASASTVDRRRADREIREESRMVPVRDPRHDQPLEIGENRVERLGLRRRAQRQRAVNSPGS